MVLIEEQSKGVGYTSTDESTAATVKNAFDDFISGAVDAITNIRLRVNKHLGQTTEDYAEHLVKKCWNHMVRNEVEAAKEVYRELHTHYEDLEEGDHKTQLYYEVRDIYDRIKHAM
jgi:hypothetical protein